MHRYIFSALLSAMLASGALLRAETPAAKVKHLVLDIEESVSKAGEDAEVVYSTFYTYGGQLENSLKKEIGTLNQTLTKLLAMQATYSVDINTSQAKSAHLGAAAQDSQKMANKYEAGTTQTRNRFDGLQGNVKMLISLLKNAGVTENGKLVTPEAPDARGEPARIYSAVRRLLGANAVVQDQHPSVYTAFLPPHAKAGCAQYPVIRMTRELLQESISALTVIKDRLGSMKSEALLQFDSLHRRFEKQAVFAGASAEAQLGLEAENEQKAAELTFSIKFTNSVLKIDKGFQEIVKVHEKSNADLIYAVRDLRQAQLKILRDLTGILGAQLSIGRPGMSFLETGAKVLHPRAALFALQTEAEAVIQKQGDTHALLMRMKDVLDESSPIDANSVRNTMVEMQAVLRSVEVEKPKLEEAKRGCESQKFHASEEEEGLKANLALMTAARDHAQKAIKAATTNVQGIEKKRQALDKSSADFARISTQSIKSLAGQSRDRKTILMAVQKAAEVVGPSLPAGVSTVQLMQSLMQDIMAQDAKESIYRANQERFQSEFARYVKDYSQLLQERRRHYESSLGVLDLHVSELANDLLAQEQTFNTGHDLQVQSRGLCESVLKFYEKHAKTRADLSSALRVIIPNMPTVLSTGAIENSGSD